MFYYIIIKYLSIPQLKRYYPKEIKNRRQNIINLSPYVSINNPVNIGMIILGKEYTEYNNGNAIS